MVTRLRAEALRWLAGLGAVVAMGASAAALGCNAIAGIHEGVLAPCGLDDLVCEDDIGAGGAGGANGAKDAGGVNGAGGAETTASSSATTGSSSVSASSGAPQGVCGDGVINAGEECDDHNAAPNDGCTGCVVDCDAAGSFKDPSSHHCYRLVSAKLSFLQANFACQLKGQHLAAITSAEELAFVSKNLKGADAWIGGQDINHEGSFVWENGEPWAYAPWKTGEPGDHADQDDCVELTSAPSCFNDEDCTKKQGYLCERSPAEGSP